MTGLEVGALFLGKLLVGKAVTYLGGHALAGASHATVAHLSQHAAINVISTAAGAGTALGAAGAAFSGAKAYDKFAKAVEKRKEKNDRIASMRPGALGDVPGPLKSELIAVVFQNLNEAYAGLELVDDDGTLKTDLSEIRINPSGECIDYSQESKGSLKCKMCGAPASEHRRAEDGDPDITLLLLVVMAAEV